MSLHPDLTTPLYPNVTVKLTGENGNVFNLISLVSRALSKNNLSTASKDFKQKALQSHSYDEVLQLITSLVNVT